MLPVENESAFDVTSLSPRELGSLLGRASEKVDVNCLQCGREMPGVTIRRRFCSPKCRQKHWRRRLAALRPGEEMVYVRRERGDPRH